MKQKKENAFTHVFGRDRISVMSIKSILKKIWLNRKFILKWELTGMIIGLIICFSIPKEYTTTIKIIPENKNNDSFQSLFLSDEDAFDYRLYPYVINSTHFLYDLLDVVVPIEQDHEIKNLPIKEILDKEYKVPWWEKIYDSIWEILKKSRVVPVHSESSQFPSEKDMNLIKRLKNNISVVVMDITDYLEIEVTLQDPIAAATLTDTIATRLERVVSQYRNQKKKLRSEFIYNQFSKAKNEYELSSQKYANFLDSNQFIIKNKNKLDFQYLNTERLIKFNEYYSNSQILLTDKLTSSTYDPIFYIIEPPTVAIKASSPKKLAILAYCMFLFGYIPLVFSIFKKYI